MSELKQTTGAESVEDYVKTYGFCHWQAQEVMRSRDELLKGLEWIIRNPGAHPANVRRVAEDAIRNAGGAA